MRKMFIIVLLALLFVGFPTADAAGMTTGGYGVRLPAEVLETGDTLPLVQLRNLYVYPKMRFRSKKQEQFYWKTVRDVKKTLPYAKALAREMQKTDSILSRMTPRQQRKFWSQYEKLLFRRYEGDLRHMTASQGQMLMNLVARETGSSSYALIDMYKGKLTASFWQGIAKIWGNDLKAGYDASDKDRITERIIILVENGQL